MMEHSKRTPSFPLRLPRTTRVQAGELARREGVSLNEFIRLAVAEKITRLEQFAPQGEAESKEERNQGKTTGDKD